MDIFRTEAWFSHLSKNGFEKQPCRHFVISLNPSASENPNSLYLLQQQSHGPLVSLSNYYSGLYGPTGMLESLQILSPAQWQTVAEMMRFSGGAVVRLQPLEAGSLWVTALENGLKAKSYWTDRFFCFANWYQIVPDGGFGVYWSQRPRALQNSVERGRRRLHSAGAWHVKVHSQEAEGLDVAIAAYEQVYAQSWKAPEPCPHFMPGLVRTAAREGWLRLGILWLDDRPLAAQIWLVEAGKASIYKLAYVQGMERFSPGSVLTAALMEQVMDVDGVREVDYLSGDDAYKRDWMAERRERIGLIAFDQRHWRGWLAAGKHFLGRWKRKNALGRVIKVNEATSWHPPNTQC